LIGHSLCCQTLGPSAILVRALMQPSHVLATVCFVVLGVFQGISLSDAFAQILPLMGMIEDASALRTF
jgi:hypothetical protein